MLRFTISYYNKKAAEDIKKLATDEMQKNHDLEVETISGTTGGEDREDALMGDIMNQRAVFLCIQTQSDSAWGLLLKMMATLGKLGLDVIDHRSWHPRGVSSTLVNEIYCRDKIQIPRKGTSQEILEKRMDEIKVALEQTVNQPTSSKIRVQVSYVDKVRNCCDLVSPFFLVLRKRWFPGVVEEIVESVHEKKKKGTKGLNIEERLLQEASAALDLKQSLQTNATREKTVEEILAGMQSPKDNMPTVDEDNEAPSLKRVKRRRQKMRSTPVVGGGLFGETDTDSSAGSINVHGTQNKVSPRNKSDWKPSFDFGARGHKAEIIVAGESYDVRISDETLNALRKGFSGDMLDTRGMSLSGVSIHPDTSNVVNQLHGYVRSREQLTRILEESVLDSESETSSVYPVAVEETLDGEQGPPV